MNMCNRNLGCRGERYGAQEDTFFVDVPAEAFVTHLRGTRLINFGDLLDLVQVEEVLDVELSFLEQEVDLGEVELPREVITACEHYRA